MPVRAKPQLEPNIMEEIEQSLIHNDGKQYYGIDDFENLFEKKKEVVDAIQQYK